MPTANSFGIKRRQLFRIGDVNPKDYDGGVVFRLSGHTGTDKPYVLVEYVQWDSDKDDATGGLYRVHLPDDVAKWCKWANIAELAASDGITEAAWRALARGTIAQRVSCLEDVAGHHGWDNLDSYPLTVTRPEIRKRYARCA